MSELDPTKRFSSRVEDYVRYRPSYPANPLHPNHKPLMAALRKLFDDHEQNGEVCFLYQTNVYWARW